MKTRIPPGPLGIPTALSSTFERLINAAEPEWRALLLVALETGLRQGELIGLQWSDLDLAQARLNVRRTIWRGVTDLPKGGRERTVDLPASAVDALKAHRHLRGRFVFCQEDGQPLTEGKMKQPLRRALNRAGISREEGRIGWHDLRHTYASHLCSKRIGQYQSLLSASGAGRPIVTREVRRVPSRVSYDQ